MISDVDDAAEEPGDEAEHIPTTIESATTAMPMSERQPRPVDQAREDVAADSVGAERKVSEPPSCQNGGFRKTAIVGDDRANAAPPRRRERNAEHADDHREADHRAGVAAERAPELAQRMRRRRGWRSDSGVSMTSAVTADLSECAPSCVPDARVDQAVGEVDQQIDGHDRWRR